MMHAKGNKIDLREFFTKIPCYLLEDSNEEQDVNNFIKRRLKELDNSHNLWT